MLQISHRSCSKSTGTLLRSIFSLGSLGTLRNGAERVWYVFYPRSSEGLEGALKALQIDSCTSSSVAFINPLSCALLGVGAVLLGS